MPPLHHASTRLLLASSLLLAACASSVGPMPLAPDDASVVADASPDASTTADARPPTCPPRQNVPTPAACGALTELATAANAVASAQNTFALSNLRASQSGHRPSCTVEPWQDRYEARVRFTPPVAGTWRLTATGEQLWALDVQRDCATPLACTGFADLHGAHASTTLTVDVPIQRGESVAVILDGCPDGTSCSYALRAQWIGALTCEVLTGATDRRCAAPGQACAIDPCDPERFRCVEASTTRPELSSVRVLADTAERRKFFVGRARVPAGASERALIGTTLMGRWLDGSGRELYFGAQVSFGPVSDGSAEFFAGYNQTPAGLTPNGLGRAVVWFYDGAPNENHPGLEVPVEAWSPRSAGEGCDPSAFAERCGPRLRCVSAGGSGRGTCRVPDAVEVTSLRAWSDLVSGSLRVAIEGQGLGDHVQRYDVTLLDRAGATLARLPDAVAATTMEFPSNVPFRTTFDLARESVTGPSGISMTFRPPPGVARVRVVARDQQGVMSDPVEGPVMNVTVAPLGAPCGDVTTGCAAGLTCGSSGSTAPSRCAPTRPERACGIGAQAPTWAPPGRGATHSLAGVAHDVGGFTRCFGGRTPRFTHLEFVAPVEGMYAFEQRGLKAIEVGRSCGSESPPSVCVVAAAGTSESRAEVALTVGQRVLIALVSDYSLTAPASFTLSVQVP